MLAQQIPSQGNDVVRQMATGRPVAHGASPAAHLAELKAREASLARSRSTWRRWELQPGRLVGLLTAQPQPPPSILRQLQSGHLLTSLRDAAEKADVQRFSEICESTDWGARSSSEITQAIRLALKAGAVMTARQLASKGAACHPESLLLQKYARLLAPPELIRTDLPARPGVQEDLAWFAQHVATHRRRWVALRDGKIVAEGSTLREVLAKVDKESPKEGLLLTRVS